MEDCHLYLVPEKVLQTWRRRQTLDLIDQPEDNDLLVKDSLVSDVLRRQDLTPYDRNALVEQEMGKLLTAKRQRESPPRQVAAPIIADDDDLTALPKTYREKAKQLLRLWQKDEDISWDESRHVFVRGREIPGSNIIDLVHHAVSRGKKEPPEGFEALRQHTLHRNYPRSLVANPLWHEAVTPPPTSRYSSRLFVTPTHVRNPIVNEPVKKWEEL